MKIHIFGASGSGVSTLGRSLSADLDVTYFDSDDYFWLRTEPPFTTRRAREERNRLISADLDRKKDWILGGSIIQWDLEIISALDLVVFLYLPPEIRIERLRKREFERYGDIIYTDPQRARRFKEFIDWAADYEGATGIASRTLKAHEAWLTEIERPILRLKGDIPLHEKMRTILDRIILM